VPAWKAKDVYLNKRLSSRRIAKSSSSIEACEKSCESFGTFVGI
jgi:hypothetical protein